MSLQKRRQSYSSARAFAARPSVNKQAPLTPTHSLTSSLRISSNAKIKNGRDVKEAIASSRQQSVTSEDSGDGVSKGGRRRSIVDLFRSKSKRRNLSSPHIDSSPTRKESTSSVASEDRAVSNHNCACTKLL